MSRALFLTLTIGFLFVGTILAQLDPTFGTNGVATAATGPGRDPLLISILPDGKIFTVGVKQWGSGSGADRLFFARSNSDGSPDAAYGTNGVIEVPIPGSLPGYGRINGAARQPDGKIIIVGSSDNLKGLIARYNEDATLDNGFASGGIHRPVVGENFAPNGLSSVLVLPDNKILVAGYARAFGASRLGLSLLRYLSNGTVDATFGNTSGYIIHQSIVLPSDRAAELFALQSDGRIIVGNKYESNGGDMATRSSIRRFNPDGGIDGSFTVINFPGSAAPLKSSLLQPDNKILAATVVTANDSLERVHNNAQISRYNADGTPDLGFGTSGQTSFDITNYQQDTPTGLQVMPDGQIVVAVYTGISRNRTIYRDGWVSMARLSPAGVLNGKFLAAASSFFGEKSLSLVLPDGKVLTVVAGVLGLDIVRMTGIPIRSYMIHGIPFNFPGVGGVDAKPSLYRPSNGSWPVYTNSGLPAGFGLPDDIPAPSDYIGSHFTPEFAFFRPSDGTWYISRQWSDTVTDFLTIRWGSAGDIPVPADYDGDGKSDVAVFRPSNAVWYIRNGSDASIRFVQWGINGDKPAVGDFDGDGLYDIAVFRPSDGNWYILRSSNGAFSPVYWGSAGDIPVPVYGNREAAFPVVYRPANQVWYNVLDPAQGRTMLGTQNVLVYFGLPNN